MIHVAVLKPKYVELFLNGTKTLECRLTRNRIEPFGRIRRGDRVYLKESSGPFRATGIVDEVIEREPLDEAGVLALREKYGDAIAAPDSFWDSKKSARYGVLIRFEKLEEVFRGPKLPTLNGRGWIRLPRAHDPYPACLSNRTKQRSARTKRTTKRPPSEAGRA